MERIRPTYERYLAGIKNGISSGRIFVTKKRGEDDFGAGKDGLSHDLLKFSNTDRLPGMKSLS